MGLAETAHLKVLLVAATSFVASAGVWAFEQVHSSSKAASSRLFSASKSLNSNGQQLKTNRVLGQMFLSDLAAMKHILLQERAQV